VRGNPSGERCAAQPSGRPHEPSGNRRPQMDGHRPSTRVGGHRTRLTDRLADAPLSRPDRPRREQAWTAPQSSSGRNVCGAVQVLQIGVAASSDPRGIGTRRSGSRHSTSYRRSAPLSIWMSRRNVHRLIRCGASRYGSGSIETVGSGRAMGGGEPRELLGHGGPDQAPDSSTAPIGTATS